MGEWFRIVAPQVKRELCWKVGLRELFFYENRVRELVPLLIVPIEPKKQSLKRAAAPSAAPANLQSGRINASTPQSIAVATPKRVDSVSASSSRRATFSTLPFEIYSLIFNHLDELADVTCVGLATPYLWGITQRIIYKRYKAMIGQWAGEKIVWVGEDLVDGDYPPDLFSAEEVETLIKEVQVWDRKRHPEDRTLSLTSINLNYLPATFDEGVWIATEAGKVYDKCLGRCERSRSAVLQARLREIRTNYPDFTARDQDWILRNLTTKEFVTAEGIALDEDFIDGPFIFGIGFGDVILARALWTSRGTSVLRYGRQIGRGIWAGHQFDITTRSRHDEATKDEEWRDVSKEVACEIAGIWESQFGPNWMVAGEFYRRFADDSRD